MGKKNSSQAVNPLGYTEDDEAALAEEARKGFDLRARLRGANKLTKNITVYTDAVAGAELGGAENVENQYGIVTGRRRWGLKGELDALQERLTTLGAQDAPDEDEVEALVAEIAAVNKKLPAALKKLDQSALVFTLTGIPEFVARDARRRAKKAAGIKGKGLDGKEEEFGLEYVPILLASSVLTWEDKASGEKYGELTVDEAKALRDELPVGQFPKLDAAMIKLSFEAQIGQEATDSVDF